MDKLIKKSNDYMKCGLNLPQEKLQKYNIIEMNHYNKKIMDTLNEICDVLVDVLWYVPNFCVFGGYPRDLEMYRQSEYDDNIKIRLFYKLVNSKKHDLDFHFNTNLSGREFENLESALMKKKNYVSIYKEFDFFTTKLYKSSKMIFMMDGEKYGIDFVNSPDFVQNDFNINAMYYNNKKELRVFRNCTQSLEEIKTDIKNGHTLMNEHIVNILSGLDNFVLSELKNNDTKIKYQGMASLYVTLRRLKKILKYGFEIKNYSKHMLPLKCDNNEHCKCEKSNKVLNIYFPYFSNLNEQVYMCYRCGIVYSRKYKCTSLSENSKFFDVIILCA